MIFKQRIKKKTTKIQQIKRIFLKNTQLLKQVDQGKQSLFNLFFLNIFAQQPLFGIKNLTNTAVVKYTTPKNFSTTLQNKKLKEKKPEFTLNRYLHGFLFLQTCLKIQNFNNSQNLNGYVLSSFWWYKFYLQAVTAQYTAFKSDWVLLNANYLLTTGTHSKIIRSVYKKNLLGIFFGPKRKFLFWFIKLTIFKDSSTFTPLFLRWLTRSPLKKHKRIFVLINKFLKFWYKTLYNWKKIKGYCIFFKGKLGRKGSVRKTKFFAKCGEVSYSSKSLRLNYQTFTFPTITGCVGGGLSLFYFNYAYI